jgi:predicted phage terminase large subunit-like protein
MDKLPVRLPSLHPAQQQMRNEQRRFNVACMGRRFGKSKYGIRGQIEEAAAGYPVAWFAPTYKLLDEVWRETTQRLGAAIAGKNKTEKSIRLLTGGSIDFWTMDDPDPARGRKYKKVRIDEAAMVPGLLDIWQKSIRPTLTDYEGGADFYSTPKGKNGFSDLFDYAGANPSEWQRWQMPTWFNPHINPVEIESARRELPELVFRQEYGAEFVDFSGALVKREMLQYAEPPPREAMIIAMGVDLAISTKETADYTAVGVVGRELYGAQRTFILDVQRARVGFHDALGFIQSLAGKWQPSIIAIEQVQAQAYAVQELLLKTSLPIVGVRPDRDKMTRFQPLLARYEQRMVYHAPNLPDAWEQELLSFSGDNRKKDDQIDAIAYAFLQLPSAVPFEYHSANTREHAHVDVPSVYGNFSQSGASAAHASRGFL